MDHPKEGKKRKDISDLEVVKAVEQYNSAPFAEPFPYETLAKRFRCDEKLAYSACERAERHGLIEYGVSLRSGWLTDKGNKLLSTNNL